MSIVSADPFDHSITTRHYLDKSQIQRLYDLNRGWLHMSAENRHKLLLREYIDSYDPAVRPFVEQVIRSISPKLVSFQEFYASFSSCCDRFLFKLLNDPLSIGFAEPIFLYAGSQFGKSNLWLTLLFWERICQHPELLELDWRLVSEQSLPVELLHAMLVIVDDCAYTGQQLEKSIVPHFSNIIICPYMSRQARERFKSIRETGIPLRLFSVDVVPSSTFTLVDFEIRDAKTNKKLSRTLAQYMKIFSFYGLEVVTWLFEHKIANSLSIPVCFFNSTGYFTYTGQVRLVNVKTREEHLITIQRKPNQIGPIVSPCPLKPSDCRDCYRSHYDRPFAMDRALEAKCVEVFGQARSVLVE